MKSVALFTLLCLPTLLLASEFNAKELLAKYALKHPNKGEDIPECEILNKQDPEVGPLNAIANRRLLWTDNTLYYEIQGSYSRDQISRIRAAVAELASRTSVGGRPCIRIQESNSAPNRVVIRDCGGCSSYVGMIRGRQQMCLAAGCISSKGIIIHEFLHAFGFHHEHMRSDRDDYVLINFDNIRPGTEGNFRKLREGVEVDLLGTRYDYGSVMHYGAYGFAVERSIPTIIPLDPSAEIGQRAGLSAMDIERVQLLYSCKFAADSVYFKHLTGLY